MVWTTPLGFPVLPEVCERKRKGGISPKSKLAVVAVFLRKKSSRTHVKDEQGILSAHDLDGADRRDLSGLLVPPSVSTLSPVDLSSSSLENEDVLDERALLESGVDDALGSDALSSSSTLTVGGEKKKHEKEMVSSSESTVKMEEGGRTNSEVITTRHSQSWARSLRDSAENPAKTTEWTAPILAQARKAAAACQVMGR